MGREQIANVEQLTVYANGLAAALAANTPLGNWTAADVSGSVLKASGIQTESKWPTIIYATKFGADVFWRIAYIDMVNLVPLELGIRH